MKVDEETMLEDIELPEHQLFALFITNTKSKDEFIQVRCISNPEEVLFTKKNGKNNASIAIVELITS